MLQSFLLFFLLAYIASMLTIIAQRLRRKP